MAIWACECRPCTGSGAWPVSREWVDALTSGVRRDAMQTTQLQRFDDALGSTLVRRPMVL